MKKWMEILKSFFGDDLKEEDITKAKGIEEDAQKTLGDALNIFEEYKDDFPPDVLGAIMTVAKTAITPEEKPEEADFVAELTNLEKAGARLSKATIAQLKKIGEIVGSLVTAAEKSITKNTPDDKHSPETLAKLEKLKAYEDAEAAAELTKAEKEKKALEDRLAEVEKQLKKKPTKKSIDAQDGDDDDDPDEKKDGDDKEFQWKSLTGQEEE